MTSTRRPNRERFPLGGESGGELGVEGAGQEISIPEQPGPTTSTFRSPKVSTFLCSHACSSRPVKLSRPPQSEITGSCS